MKKTLIVMFIFAMVTSLASCKESKKSAEPQLMYEENGLSIYYKSISEKDNGIGIDLLIENDSDKKYTVQTRDFYINGYGVEVAFSPKVASGKKLNYDIRIINSELEKNDLSFDNIETIEFNFHTFDEHFDNDFDSPTVTIDLLKNKRD